MPINLQIAPWMRPDVNPMGSAIGKVGGLISSAADDELRRQQAADALRLKGIETMDASLDRRAQREIAGKTLGIAQTKLGMEQERETQAVNEKEGIAFKLAQANKDYQDWLAANPSHDAQTAESAREAAISKNGLMGTVEGQRFWKAPYRDTSEELAYKNKTLDKKDEWLRMTLASKERIAKMDNAAKERNAKLFAAARKSGAVNLESLTTEALMEQALINKQLAGTPKYDAINGRYAESTQQKEAAKNLVEILPVLASKMGTSTEALQAKFDEMMADQQ